MILLRILSMFSVLFAPGSGANLQWFFNPFSENIRTLNIGNHAKVLDERLGISRANRDTEADDYETETMDDMSRRPERGRSLEELRSSDPQLPPFRFRPFESLARNINFRSPSNVFCKSHFSRIKSRLFQILEILSVFSFGP